MDVSEEYSGFAYVGRSTLRHPDEEASQQKSPADSYDEYAEMYPERYPHVFVDFSDNPVTVGELLSKGSAQISGSSGVIVQFRKGPLSGPTINQVNKWRDSFSTDMLPSDIDNLTDENLEDIDLEGEPFVILKPGAESLDVPLTIQDKLDRIREAEEELGTSLLDSDDPSEAEVNRMFEAMKTLADRS